MQLGAAIFAVTLLFLSFRVGGEPALVCLEADATSGSFESWIWSWPDFEDRGRRAQPGLTTRVAVLATFKNVGDETARVTYAQWDPTVPIAGVEVPYGSTLRTLETSGHTASMDFSVAPGALLEVGIVIDVADLCDGPVFAAIGIFSADFFQGWHSGVELALDTSWARLSLPESPGNALSDTSYVADGRMLNGALHVLGSRTLQVRFRSSALASLNFHFTDSVCSIHDGQVIVQGSSCETLCSISAVASCGSTSSSDPEKNITVSWDVSSQHSSKPAIVEQHFVISCVGQPPPSPSPPLLFGIRPTPSVFPIPLPTSAPVSPTPQPSSPSPSPSSANFSSSPSPSPSSANFSSPSPAPTVSPSPTPAVLFLPSPDPLSPNPSPIAAPDIQLPVVNASVTPTSSPVPLRIPTLTAALPSPTPTTSLPSPTSSGSSPAPLPSPLSSPSLPQIQPTAAPPSAGGGVCISCVDVQGEGWVVEGKLRLRMQLSSLRSIPAGSLQVQISEAILPSWERDPGRLRIIGISASETSLKRSRMLTSDSDYASLITFEVKPVDGSDSALEIQERLFAMTAESVKLPALLPIYFRVLFRPATPSANDQMVFQWWWILLALAAGLLLAASIFFVMKRRANEPRRRLRRGSQPLASSPDDVEKCSRASSEEKETTYIVLERNPLFSGTDTVYRM